jgi:hypothetical protein
MSLTLAFAAPAAAQMQLVEPGRLTCSAPAGEVREQAILPPRVGKELRVAFRLLEEHARAGQPVLAALFLDGAGGRTRVAVRKESAHVYVSVTPPAGHEQIVYQYPLTKDWIILKLTLSARGDLTVGANHAAPRFPIGSAQLAKATLQCGSGQWEFDVWPRSYAARAQTTEAN